MVFILLYTKCITAHSFWRIRTTQAIISLCTHERMSPTARKCICTENSCMRDYLAACASCNNFARICNTGTSISHAGLDNNFSFNSIMTGSVSTYLKNSEFHTPSIFIGIGCSHVYCPRKKWVTYKYSIIISTYHNAQLQSRRHPQRRRDDQWDNASISNVWDVEAEITRSLIVFPLNFIWNSLCSGQTIGLENEIWYIK